MPTLSGPSDITCPVFCGIAFEGVGHPAWKKHDAGQTVMCVMNTNSTSSTIKMDRFAERAAGFTKAYDVATGVTFNLEQNLTVVPNYLLVMELRK